ncbi:NAD(P)-dependent alcohol dehydrogenase [Crenalkalicoccus roseus]|uniref:NAD(P)-dependent alcohol dehydrogenase n=1 Tax=Crenalkalicoccus roseus TaxID=1485588 RepID=UPI001081801B|nr:NAD(P)-dependent alcohol dehydrogenase [Crenalkalicoccus roseus]
MRITAAIARTPRAPLELAELEIEPPREDEVLVRVVACGVCHTDLVCRDQELPVPLPAVLGHEGAGIVEQVGGRVATVRPGDKVLLSYDSCGGCPSCRAAAPFYCHQFGPFNFGCRRPDGTTPLRAEAVEVGGRFFGQSAFATHCIARERNLVRVAPDAPLETYAPLGCGVQTGAGTVMNALRPEAGSSIAVFGCGTVGLSAILGAVLQGCARILAVDPNPARREMARAFGATDLLDPKATNDVPAAVRELLGEGGAGSSVECTGLPEVAAQAAACLAPRGVCAIVGAAPADAAYTFPAMPLLVQGWTIRGVIEGESRPAEFLPRLIALHGQGRFPFDRMIRRYPFTEINEAMAASARGEAIKPVLVM